jgi:hypothetical protein
MKPPGSKDALTLLMQCSVREEENRKPPMQVATINPPYGMK